MDDEIEHVCWCKMAEAGSSTRKASELERAAAGVRSPPPGWDRDFLRLAVR